MNLSELSKVSSLEKKLSWEGQIEWKENEDGVIHAYRDPNILGNIVTRKANITISWENNKKLSSQFSTENSNKCFTWETYSVNSVKKLYTVKEPADGSTNVTIIAQDADDFLRLKSVCKEDLVFMLILVKCDLALIISFDDSSESFHGWVPTNFITFQSMWIHELYEWNLRWSFTKQYWKGTHKKKKSCEEHKKMLKINIVSRCRGKGLQSKFDELVSIIQNEKNDDLQIGLIRIALEPFKSSLTLVSK